MKISMKMLAASVALATLTMSGAANAAIAISSGTNQGGAIQGPGELFLTAFDAAGKQSYSRDLGIYETAMVANLNQPLSYNLNTLDTGAPDTNWATFIGTGSKGVGVIYTVTAANIDILTLPSAVGFLTTSPSTVADIHQSVQDYSTIINSTQAINFFAQDSNADAGQTAVNTYADNNSSRSVPGDTAYFPKGTWGINDGGKTFLTIGQIGSSVPFYSVLLNTNGYNSAIITKQRNAWKLDTAGNLTYSAVPVPAAIWLFGSGILGMVGIARRRKV